MPARLKEELNYPKNIITITFASILPTLVFYNK
jgi:hypothetical protein